MQTLWQDLRYGARMLMKKPGFTLIAVVTLALGIGATTAIFSIVNAVLLHPFAYPTSEEIMFLTARQLNDPDSSRPVSYPNFQEWRKQQQVFSHMTAAQAQQLTLTGVAVPAQVRGAYISPDAFPLLGIAPQLGRVFTENESRPAAERTVVISHAFWQERCGAAADIVGKPLRLGDQQYTVLGVMPPEFKFWAAEVWLPFGLIENEEITQSRIITNGNFVVARLKPGVTQAQAQAEMDVIVARIALQYPDTDKGVGVGIMPLNQSVTLGIRPALLILLGAVGFVLLIACANVANLLFTQAATREKEIAIRAALGATRGRLIVQLLTETVPLAVLGSLAGLLMASWGLAALLALLPADAIPAESNVRMDSRVLLFALGVTLLTTLICGLLPALRFSRADVNESLKDGGRTSTGGLRNRRVRNALVVVEVALSVVLLIGAGLLIRSFQRMQNVPLGFQSEQLVSLDVSLPEKKYSQPQQSRWYFQNALERLKATPGVKAAALMSGAPFSGSGNGLPLVREGETFQSLDELTQKRGISYNQVAGDTLQTLGLPLRAGRALNEQDTASSQPVVVINQALADKFFAGENPLGKRILLGLPDNLIKPGLLPKGLEKFSWLTIVGVVGTVRQFNLTERPTLAAYVPYAQAPPTPGMLNNNTLLVRTTNDPATLINTLRQQLLAVDPDQPILRLAAMDTLITETLKQPRFSVLLMGIFAALALVLAAVGLYGVLAYTVVQRTHEIGIRLALGATARDVLRLVIGQGMRLALSGVVVGLAAAFALTRLLERLLFEVKARDPLTFILVALALTAIALLACWLPARRAAKVDPMIALRCE